MLVAKAVVAAAFSSFFAAVMVVASIVVARSDLDWRLVGAIALYAVLAAVLGVGVGALLRASAGAVALLLLWPLVAEPMLGNLPNISSEVGPYLPFANAFTFIDVQWLYPYYAMPWGELGSIVYFAARGGGRVRRGAGHRQPTRRMTAPARAPANVGAMGRKSRAVSAVLADGRSSRPRSVAVAASPRRKPPTRPPRPRPPVRRPNSRRRCAGRSRPTR